MYESQCHSSCSPKRINEYFGCAYSPKIAFAHRNEHVITFDSDLCLIAISRAYSPAEQSDNLKQGLRSRELVIRLLSTRSLWKQRSVCVLRAVIWLQGHSNDPLNESSYWSPSQTLLNHQYHLRLRTRVTSVFLCSEEPDIWLAEGKDTHTHC